MEILHTIYVDDTVEVEKAFHNCFASKRVKGERFNLTEEDIAYIQTIKEV